MLLVLLLALAQAPLDPALLGARSAWIETDGVDPKALEAFDKAWRADLREVRLVSSAQEADLIVTLGAANERGGTYLTGGQLVIASMPQDWTLRVRTRLGTESLYDDAEAIGAKGYAGLKALVQRLAARRKGR